MTIGIYKITNIVNGKIYIGKSLNIEQRFNRHINELNRNSNHNPHFQNAWNKYGEDKFKFEIIHTLEVYDKEIINLYNDGYRIVDICNELDLNRKLVEHILYDRKLHIGRKNQKILKYENIYNEVIRLHNEGFINYHIAKQLNISPSTVRRYIDKYNNQQANTEVSQEIKES